MTSSPRRCPHSPRRIALLVLAALAWTFFSAFTLRGCLKPEKPSQLLLVPIDIAPLKLSDDEDTLRRGRSLYLQHCLQCHLPDGSGGVGLSLVDDAWVLGGDTDTILRVIAGGTTNGMPGWGNSFSPEDLSAVTSYVFSINPHLEIPADRRAIP